MGPKRPGPHKSLLYVTNIDQEADKGANEGCTRQRRLKTNRPRLAAARPPAGRQPLNRIQATTTRRHNFQKYQITFVVTFLVFYFFQSKIISCVSA